MTRKAKRLFIWGICSVSLVLLLGLYYVRTHPLVFNESFWGHAHCIKQAGFSLRMYANDHGGRFPSHTNGYGDALLLVEGAWLPSFTGPGYDTAVLERALLTGEDVDEGQCGRVYVQGLSVSQSPEIALLFDKLPNPGDHRKRLSRVLAPMVREVWLLEGSMRVVPESEWADFARRQVELLVQAGMPIEEAQQYYSDESGR